MLILESLLSLYSALLKFSSAIRMALLAQGWCMGGGVGWPGKILGVFLKSRHS